MSWADDGDDGDDRHGQVSPTTTSTSTTLRHFFKRVTRKLGRTTTPSPSSPSSPTATITATTTTTTTIANDNHNSHPPGLSSDDATAQRTKRKSFSLFGRRRTSSQPLPPNPPQLQTGTESTPPTPTPTPGVTPSAHVRPSHPSHPISPRRRPSSIPNLLQLNPFPLLPNELVYAILLEAAHDHCTARRLVLVSRQVKSRVEKVLYANVHLGDMALIRLFARTVREASVVPRLPELRLGAAVGVGVGVGVATTAGGRAGGPAREASRERVLGDLREEEECSTTAVVAHPLQLTSTARTRPPRLLVRFSPQLPPASSSSSSSLSLPAPLSPSPSFALSPSTTTTTTAAAAAPVSTASTLTRAFFATTVRALTLAVHEDHFHILYPDVLESAWLILCTCDAVRELEVSGDLIRRTDPALIPVPPASPSPSTVVMAMGAPAGTGIGTPGPPVLPPIPSVMHGDALLPSTSTSATHPPPTAPSTSALPPPAPPTLHTDLYAARMRPTHLTLLAPHNNVNFHLPMLQHVTHLRYAICPPRILGWQSTNDGSVTLGGHALGQVNVTATNNSNASNANNANNNTNTNNSHTPGGTTGQGRLLRHLTHVAFDYQIGRESGHGGMGIGVWGAGHFVGIVREALAEGGSSGAPLELAPHAEEGSGSGSGSGSGNVQGPGLGPGLGLGLAGEDQGSPPPLPPPPLERVVVKIILRPRAEVLSRFNAIWPRLDAVRKADARLVYFGAKWRDNEMFGENLWERVRAIEERRGRERERGRGRGRQRSNSAASAATATGAGGGRRRASSVSIGWFQDG